MEEESEMKAANPPTPLIMLSFKLLKVVFVTIAFDEEREIQFPLMLS